MLLRNTIYNVISIICLALRLQAVGINDPSQVDSHTLV